MLWPDRAAEAIVLVGFMAAGKSVVGRRLAHRLGWRFVDLDREIERVAGRSISEIFETGGEAAFRELERQATAALAPLRATVLATGGGWVLDADAVRRLGTPVVRVWLRVSVDEALRRLASDAAPRPLLAASDARATAAALLRAREPVYAQAEHVVDVDRKAIDEVVAAIMISIGFG